MRGNLVKLTIGGYFYQQPGIITGFSYEMNDDNATWEIGIDDAGNTDDSVKQLPHLIKVSGFNFIPIHDFVPKRVPMGLANENTNQRYIALADGPGISSTNYKLLKNIPKSLNLENIYTGPDSSEIQSNNLS